MIYRHYKGKLYYNLGIANRFSKEFPNKSVELVAMARFTEPETEEQKEPIEVFSVLDKETGMTYYAYNSDRITGIHTFYKDLGNEYWLRPREMFFGEVAPDVPRFKKCGGEELFDLISMIVG